MPQFQLQLSDKQWLLLTRSTAELMCDDTVSKEMLPGLMKYQRPSVTIQLDSEIKFKNFLKHTLTVIGREYFTFEMVVNADSFVKLQTKYGHMSEL